MRTVTTEDERAPVNLTSQSAEDLPPTVAGQLDGTDTRQTPALVATADLDAGWTPYFTYNSVYEDQRQAIETFLDMLGQSGYYLKEGACGTGKTLAAVTASIHAMRNPDALSNRAPDGASFPTYTRTLVVTPVKQQLQQFIGEMRAVNASLPPEVDPIPTIVLRGRGDMMAIKNAPLPDSDSRDDIQDLRQTTRTLIQYDSDIPLDWPDEMDPPAYSQVEYDWSNPSENAEQARETHQYDPHRAQAVRTIVTNLTPNDGGTYDRLRVGDTNTPYPAHVPHTGDVVDAERLQSSSSNQLPANTQGRFDPFYAATFSAEGRSVTGFGDAPNHVVDKQVLFEKAVRSGQCPHELMGMLARRADVVLGNYNHLLDPETRNLTDGKLGLLDEKTIAVVDEAHQLEAKSRDTLSTAVDLYTLDKARRDVRIARHYASGTFPETPTPRLNQRDSQTARRVARDELYLEAGGVEIEDLIAVEQMLVVAKEQLIVASEKIDDIRFGEADTASTRTQSMNSPTNPEWGDHLTRALEQHKSISPAALEVAEPVMRRVEAVFRGLADEEILDRSPQGADVGSFFRQWAETPPEVYHPETRLVPSEKESFPEKYPDWVEHYTPELRLFNCIPQRELRRVFGELGGGVLMSATLRPVSPLREATGINAVPYAGALAEPPDDELGQSVLRANGVTAEMMADMESRPTTYDQFPLRFAPENRLSLVAGLPRFTKKNRGEPYDDGDPVVDPERMLDARAQYADLIAQVARTNGNVLVAMPNYEEAAWAHDFLQTIATDKRCLVDESTSADETDALLEEFFQGGDAILCTGLRGTITEGVDFDGDKLHTCLNIGVPLLPSDSRRTAVEVAYSRAIDSTSGPDAAQRIPATRKIRQSIGRAIRGADEMGVRIIADERFGTAEAPNLRRLLSPQQQQEFSLIDPADVETAITRFWATQE